MAAVHAALGVLCHGLTDGPRTQTTRANAGSVQGLMRKSNQNFILIHKITLELIPVLTSVPSAGVCLELAWQCGRWPVGMMSLQKQWCHGILSSLWQIGISFILCIY